MEEVGKPAKETEVAGGATKEDDQQIRVSEQERVADEGVRW